MEKRIPLLSICIPTYNRLDIMKKTLTSIYADLGNVNLLDFEVIISDNSPEQSTKDILTDFKYSNLRYFATQCEGFFNSYHALSYGQGEYLKLHNNYTMLAKGTLKEMIDEIKKYRSSKPMLFFTNGLRFKRKIIEYNSFDTFMADLSYFSSWSSGFGIWKNDFDKIKNVPLDRMFPQTTLLMTQHNKNSYIINDLPIFIDQSVPKKGGYNIFKVFSVDYVSLIKHALDNKLIIESTFTKIKKELLYEYLSVRYFKTVIAKLDNFEHIDIKKNIQFYYSTSEYYLMVITAYFTPFYLLKRKFKGII